MAAFAKEFDRREAELAGAGEKLRAERDQEIRAAHLGGLPEEAIARVMKISQQRVSQIVRS